VLDRTDPDSGLPLVDVILDQAEHKGTGKWMTQNAFDIGVPTPTINAALEARLLSALKVERVAASRILSEPSKQPRVDRQVLVDAVRRALYASKITSYAQGIALLQRASLEYGYDIDAVEVVTIWRAGCIIRADVLGKIRAGLRRIPAGANLMLDGEFARELHECDSGWRAVAGFAVRAGVPAAAITASLGYYDAFRSERLPANLTQAQRDFFGAHTYRRLDREGVFHTDWSAPIQSS
jgi:6-phosphogluconate dehydrogenase